MILSKVHRFIFIKGIKVGGTSVEIALSRLCGPDDIVTPITPIDELKRLDVNAGARNYSADREAELAYLEALRQTALPDLAAVTIPAGVYFNHIPLRDVFRLSGADIEEYRVVCVERHPYAKIFSWANHKLTFDAYRTGGEMRASPFELRQYLDRAVEDGSVIAVKNIDRYRRPDGSISAHVMRFENLNDDFQGFVAGLGMRYRVWLPHAKRGILANNLDPRDLLDRRQLTIINETFCEEFEAFRYDPL
jgi:hypothetical protein